MSTDIKPPAGLHDDGHGHAEHAADHTDGHEAHDDQGHPSEKQYIFIALGLAAITAIEVALSYAKFFGNFTNPMLLFFAMIKFIVVAGYFMHLRFDNKVLRRFFIGGFVLAVFCYVSVMLTFGVVIGN